MQNAERRTQNIRKFWMLCSLFCVLSSLLLAGCALLRPKPLPILRPGCEFHVVDDMAGLPLARVRISVFTLRAGRDTVGKWSFATDEDGIATVTSLRVDPKDAKARRQADQYIFIAVFEKEGFCYYSQRITAQIHRVVMSRECPMAWEDQKSELGSMKSGVHSS